MKHLLLSFLVLTGLTNFAVAFDDDEEKSGSLFSAAPRLPALSVDPSQVTVSGISSGGFMAVQMHIAHSKTISGAASIAGGVYWCAEGSEGRSINQCMWHPDRIEVDRYIAKAEAEAKAGSIDPTSSLTDSKVYIFASPMDMFINQGSSFKLKEFYQHFVNKGNIRTRFDLPAAHGFPTVAYGSACGIAAYPWLLACGFDAAGEILNHLYGNLSAPVVEKWENLLPFDQTEFDNGKASLFRVGRVYVPNACMGGKQPCRLHIAFHGCGQGPEIIGTQFSRFTGYNRWAEANNTIVLYPTVRKSSGNPTACWDWVGYTGGDYVQKSGAQIQAIKDMIDRLKGLTH